MQALIKWACSFLVLRRERNLELAKNKEGPSLWGDRRSLGGGGGDCDVLIIVRGRASLRKGKRSNLFGGVLLLPFQNPILKSLQAKKKNVSLAGETITNRGKLKRRCRYLNILFAGKRSPQGKNPLVARGGKKGRIRRPLPSHSNLPQGKEHRSEKGKWRQQKKIHRCCTKPSSV